MSLNIRQKPLQNIMLFRLFVTISYINNSYSLLFEDFYEALKCSYEPAFLGCPGAIFIERLRVKLKLRVGCRSNSVKVYVNSFQIIEKMITKRT